MKKLLLIIISIILFSPLMAQETNNDENQARKKIRFYIWDELPYLHNE